MASNEGLEAQLEAAARHREAELSAAERRRNGVVHTPPYLSHYILGRADAALRGLGFGEGVADASVEIIDPACGPGIFLASAMELGAKPAQLWGIDVDRGAIAVGRKVFGSGVKLESKQTLGLHLGKPAGPRIICGNPPWSGRVDGAPEQSDAQLLDFRVGLEGERKLGVLSDAYVRFLRWAAEGLREGPGVLAMVTNNSYLNGPVHRGMRQRLGEWFDRVEITDLGGSALVARREGADANVFGVRPGAAIVVASRSGKPSDALGQVYYRRLRGTLEEKTAALAGEASFEELPVEGPSYLWVPVAGEKFPEGWVSLAELFPFHREGIQTNRDDVAVAPDAATMSSRLQAIALGLRRADVSKAQQSSRHFDPEGARKKLAEVLSRDPEGHSICAPLAYRPFDERVCVVMHPLCHRPRPELLEAAKHSKRLLLSVRKDRGDKPWRHVAVTQAVPDNCYFSSRSSCRTRAFPSHDPSGASNLSPLAQEWAAKLGGEDALFDYALGILSAASYQAQYEGALKHDYPRVPPPGENAGDVAAAGARLSAAFLEPTSCKPDALENGAIDGAAEAEIGHRRLVFGAAFLAALDACETAAVPILAKA